MGLSRARLINRTHFLVDCIINDKCKLRGFRLNTMSRIPSLSALFTSRLLGRDRAGCLFCGLLRNISRSIYNPLRCWPLLARYRVKISAAPCNLASCMKNLPSRFLARFLPKPPIASHLAIPCDINEITPHENASRQIRPRLEAHYYRIMRWATSGQGTSLNYAACKLKRVAN